MKTKLIFYHRSLVQHGGAEQVLLSDIKLLQEEYNVTLICARLNPLFHVHLKGIHNVILSSTWNRQPMLSKSINSLYSTLRLAIYLCLHRPAKVLTSTSCIEIVVVCFLLRLNLVYIDHHPISMQSSRSLRDYKPIQRKLRLYDQNTYEFYFRERKEGPIKATLYQLYLAIQYQVYHLASTIIVLSDYSRKEKKTICNRVANIIEPSVVLPPLCKDYSLKYKSTGIISVSRLEPEKNIDLLLSAFDMLVDTLPDSLEQPPQLSVIGDGSCYSDLKQISLTGKSSQWIDMPGYLCQADMFQALANHKIFVCLQLADYNLTVIEALSQGCIIVAGATTYIPPFIPAEYIITTELDVISISNALRSALTRKLPEFIVYEKTYYQMLRHYSSRRRLNDFKTLL